ncbi:hypothetical protein TNIN_365121 [Trichonephila inaurata madagascariensis]|uniref:Uncharacterized protein n=1 Tax=Trichonephila inaurata madagascariensis TaxID=2747483 RepID=A0A8X6Y304_9ARAC|nr:hypothetical protein TNIN_365121 [Trichonephila inaurata madagascariensis]
MYPDIFNLPCGQVLKVLQIGYGFLPKQEYTPYLLKRFLFEWVLFLLWMQWKERKKDRLQMKQRTNRFLLFKDRNFNSGSLGHFLIERRGVKRISSSDILLSQKRT